MDRLDELASLIKDRLHKGRQCLIHFKDAGVFLKEVKDTMPHGNSREAKETDRNWTKWLKENVQISKREAEYYIELSQKWTSIKPEYEKNPALGMMEALNLDKKSATKRRYKKYRDLPPDPNFSMKDIRLEVGDCAKVLSPIVDIGSVALVYTDPVYTKAGVYDDRVYLTTSELANQFLRPDGLLAVYNGNMYHYKAMCDLAEYLEPWQELIVLHKGQTGKLYCRPFISDHKCVQLCHRKGAQIKEKNYDVMTTVIPRGSNGGEKEYHPWQQRLDEAEWLVRNLTRPGDLVVDFYMGSGTVAVACYKHGRRFIGCDIVPGYVAVTQHRLKAAEKGVEWKLEDLAVEQQPLFEEALMDEEVETSAA